MKKSFILSISLITVFILAACQVFSAPLKTVVTPPPVQVPATPAPAKQVPQGFTKTDQTGAVVVEVTPEDLSGSADPLVFDISMNTHSVNLSMDLAALSTLTTDTGLSVTAENWDGPAEGGHHVSGKLTFPGKVDGKAVLQGAKSLTLTIKNVDAAQRVFTWELAK